MTSDSFTPLLSEKPLSEFTPEEFRAHIKGLFRKEEKATPKEFSWRLNKKGTFMITMKRKPKWLSLSEIEEICKESGLSQREMWLFLEKKEIKVSTQKEEDKIKLDLKEVPF